MLDVRATKLQQALKTDIYIYIHENNYQVSVVLLYVSKMCIVIFENLESHNYRSIMSADEVKGWKKASPL